MLCVSVFDMHLYWKEQNKEKEKEWEERGRAGFSYSKVVFLDNSVSARLWAHVRLQTPGRKTGRTPLLCLMQVMRGTSAELRLDKTACWTVGKDTHVRVILAWHGVVFPAWVNLSEASQTQLSDTVAGLQGGSEVVWKMLEIFQNCNLENQN